MINIYKSTWEGNETALNLDFQTRWNIMLFMLEKLEEISSAIHFSDEEFNLLFSIIAALTPVKLTINALCRKDVNLLTADASLTFMLGTLFQQKSAIALELLEALKSSILLRRTELSQTLQYLHKSSQDVGEVFKFKSRRYRIYGSCAISSQISNESVLESDKVNVNVLKKKNYRQQ